MQDSEIVDLYWNKDENAIKESQNKYGNYCYSISYNILYNNEDAQECVNDTFLGAWNAIPPHHPLILSTFLGKICRRLSLNKYRQRNAEKRGSGQVSLSFDELQDALADNSFKEQMDAQYLSEAINEFLSQEKVNNRKVFVCRYFYFESVEDIAKRFGYSQSKVKMILKRTRDKLKTYLQKEGYLS